MLGQNNLGTCVKNTTIKFSPFIGLACEGIYRISGVKSKVQSLKDAYNRGQPVYLPEYEPNVIASLLKLFLRELPEPVLTTEYMPKFEQASSKKFIYSQKTSKICLTFPTTFAV